VVFEAYMHGVPVIGARAGGIPEQIDEARTGWLFEAGSAADLAGVLGGLVTDRRDRALDRQAFADRLDTLDPCRVATLYEDAYADAIDRRRSARRIIRPATHLAEHTGNG
jgi:glycosyltransferase involved in cell wall biosynthesis